MEHLKIGLHRGWHHDSKQVRNEKGSLRDFPKLATLDWAQIGLFAPGSWDTDGLVRLVDHLPVSPEWLRLADCEESALLHVVDIAEAPLEWLPRPHYIYVSVSRVAADSMSVLERFFFREPGNQTLP